MKKLLLGTTAIVGASVLAATAAQAAKPELKIDGYLRFETWFVSQDLDDVSNQGVHMETDDVEIHFQGSATADNGLEYGFYAELQEGGTDGSAGYDEANVFLAGNWGRLDMGSQDAAYDNYNVAAFGLSADKDGAWDGNNLFSTGGNTAPIQTSLYGSDANKITYTTPSFSGVTVGVSYTPDASASMNSGISAETGDEMQDLIGGAVRYQGSFSDVGVEATARFVRGEVDEGLGANANDVNAYGVGAKISYAGFGFAASYTNLGDSGITAANEAAGADAGSWWDVGVNYETGPYKVSVVYMNSEADVANATDDEVEYLQIGAKYAVADGLDIYAAYQNVQLDRAGTANDNDVNNFMVGTNVSF